MIFVVFHLSRDYRCSSKYKILDNVYNVCLAGYCLTFAVAHIKQIFTRKNEPKKHPIQTWIKMNELLKYFVIINFKMELSLISATVWISFPYYSIINWANFHFLKATFRVFGFVRLNQKKIITRNNLYIFINDQILFINDDRAPISERKKTCLDSLISMSFWTVISMAYSGVIIIKYILHSTHYRSTHVVCQNLWSRNEFNTKNVC